MRPECERIEILLSGYVDGELSTEASREVEEHVGACAACRRTVEEFRGLERLYEGVEPKELGAERWARMERTVRPRGRNVLTAGPRRIPMEIRVRGRSWWAGALAGGLAAAGALLVVGMWWMSGVGGVAGPAGGTNGTASLFDLATDNTAQVTAMDCPSQLYDANVRLPRDAEDLLVVDVVQVDVEGENAL